MNLDDIDFYAESKFEKILVPLKQYTLIQLKIQQLKSKNVFIPGHMEALQDELSFQKEQILEVLLQDVELK